MMAASENVKDQPVTVPELIGFYTEVLNGISASDKTLVRAFRDTSNLTAEQRDAYAQWLDARNAFLQDIIQLAMERHIFEVDNRN
ncbi:hypothetical protein [Brucella haematophila]|uniref:hypothetical protein n=1 Tax=Brucella haematophila TaxID=419474 RepID=UPI00110DA23A|nr:hypothetical protein [Brucella haematophila]TMV03152.1 hypothetical protein FGI60_12120 [Brucella haematophila]